MGTYELKRDYAIAVALLCKCSANIDKNSDSKEYLLDSIEKMAGHWCELSGWSCKRMLDQIEVFPPDMPDE